MNVQAYLAQQPDGIASHPQAGVKMSCLRCLYDGMITPALLDQLPTQVKYMVLYPPPDLGFVPEVYAQSLLLALRSAHFDDDETFMDHCLRRTDALFAGVVYRNLFRLFIGERAGRLLPRTWSRFHRGGKLYLLDTSPHHLTARIEHPANLYPPLFPLVALATIHAAIKVGGAREVMGQVEGRKPGGFTLTSNWLNPSDVAIGASL